MKRVALVALLLGCGKHAAAPVTHQVDIQMMKFVPEGLVVHVGDTVVWTNHDMVPHTATARLGTTTIFDSQSIAPNATWSYTVTTAGDLPYVCSFHPTMKGALLAPTN